MKPPILSHKLIHSIPLSKLQFNSHYLQRYGPYNDGYRGGYGGGGYGGYGYGGGGRISDLYYGGGNSYGNGYGRGGGLVRSSSNYGDLYNNNNRGGYYGGGYRTGRLSDQGKYYNDGYGNNGYGRSGYSGGYGYADNRYSGGLTPYYQNQYGRGSSTYKPLFGGGGYGKTYLNDYGYGNRSGYSPYYNPDRDGYYHQPQTSGERNSY